jgi:hypothetical protein
MNNLFNLKIIVKQIIKEQLENQNITKMIHVLVDSLYNVDREKARSTYDTLMNYVLSSHYQITDVIDLIYQEIMNKDVLPMDTIRSIRMFESMNNGIRPKGKEIRIKYIQVLRSI